jgi:hypothetical protein
MSPTGLSTVKSGSPTFGLLASPYIGDWWPKVHGAQCRSVFDFGPETCAGKFPDQLGQT